MKKKDLQRVITPVFRVSFPRVFKAEAFEDQPAKFSCTLLFPKNADLSEMKKAVHAAKVATWGSDQAEWPKKLRTPFRDGDEKEDLEGYKGMIYVTVSNKHKPQVVDKNLEPITEESDDFYAGCKARAALRAFTYDTKGNKGVTFSLESLQKMGEGERFSGRMKAEDVFTKVAEDEDTSAESDESNDDSDEDGGF